MSFIRQFGFLVLFLAFSTVSRAQCGITYVADPTLYTGILDFTVDFSGLTDPAQGAAQLELYDWEGVLVDGMSFSSGMTNFQFMLFDNENLDIVLYVQDGFTGCSDTIYDYVTCNNLPGNFICDPRFSYSSDSLNMDFTFQSVAPYNPPTCTYSWMLNWDAYYSGFSVSHTYSDSVIHNVVVSLNVQGPDCFYPNGYLEDTISVGYIPECNASFDLVGDSVSQGIYYAYNCSYGGFITYFWDFGDGGTSTEAFPTYVYNTIGTYGICLTVQDTSGCQSTFCDSIDVVVKSQGTTLNVLNGFSGAGLDKSQKLNLNVYPNPSDGDFTIAYTGNKDEWIELRILDSSGRLVLSRRIPSVKGENKYHLALEFLENGMYIYQIKDNKGVLLIQK